MNAIPFDVVRDELQADAVLDLAAASFIMGRCPHLAWRLIDLAAQALALRAHWDNARATGGTLVGPPP